MHLWICMYVSMREMEKQRGALCFWWSRSHMELEHSEGQCVGLTPNNSLRDGTKLSCFNGVWHLGKCKIFTWQTFMAPCVSKRNLSLTCRVQPSPTHFLFIPQFSSSEQSTWTLQYIHGYAGGVVSAFWASQPIGVSDLEAEGSSKISTLNLLVSTAPKDNLENLTCSLTDRTSPPQLWGAKGCLRT